jgi:hypothetical protein
MLQVRRSEARTAYTVSLIVVVVAVMVVVVLV